MPDTERLEMLMRRFADEGRVVIEDDPDDLAIDFMRGHASAMRDAATLLFNELHPDCRLSTPGVPDA